MKSLLHFLLIKLSNLFLLDFLLRQDILALQRLDKSSRQRTEFYERQHFLKFIIVCVSTIAIDIDFQWIVLGGYLCYHRNDEANHSLVQYDKHLPSIVFKIAQDALLEFSSTKAFLFMIDVVFDAKQVDARSHQSSSILHTILTRNELGFVIAEVVIRQA